MKGSLRSLYQECEESDAKEIRAAKNTKATWTRKA
jgi:hypothetical protein